MQEKVNPWAVYSLCPKWPRTPGPLPTDLEGLPQVVGSVLGHTTKKATACLGAPGTDHSRAVKAGILKET